MNKLLKDQPQTKAKKFCKIIRESVEFSKEQNLNEESKEQNNDQAADDEDDHDIREQDYNILKNDVLRILQRRIDSQTYDKKLIKCHQIATTGDSDLPLGISLTSLAKTYKKVIRDNQRK